MQRDRRRSASELRTTAPQTRSDPTPPSRPKPLPGWAPPDTTCASHPEFFQPFIALCFRSGTGAKPVALAFRRPGPDGEHQLVWQNGARLSLPTGIASHQEAIAPIGRIVATKV